ncbi:hypothetical protein IGI04_021435, partial [Brassica rapa subsp. trilocularis]
TTNHAYRISFLSTTRVRPCEQLPESLSGFEPVKFKDVLDGTLSADFLVDIIGQIIEISHLEHVNVNGKETEKISLQLRNSDDDKLPVVLWGKFACDVNEAMQVRDEHCTILVLRFGKIKEWKEERSVSNAYNVSELGLNLPMIEVEKFTDSLPKDDLPLTIVESKYAAIANGVSDKDDFFTHTPRKTIAQMKETKHVEKCILMCTIAGIDSDMGWFYLSCKVCSKKVLTVPAVNDDDGNDDDDLKHTYYCVKCEAYNPVTVPKYKLHLVVLDNTSNTKLMVFDNLAVQLVNKPCLQIAGPSDKVEIEETNVLPPVLNTIIGKTCLFKIQIERENFVYKHDTYKVLKVITNKDLITDFEESNSRDGSEGVFHDMDTQSDAPEASLANLGSASEQSESCDLTPAKRVRAVDIELEEINDQNSVTRSTGSMMIKKEKTTNHAYRISFLSTTRVRPCEQLPEDLSGFEPVKFKEVLDGTLSADFLVDLIGQIIEISHLEHLNVNGKETEKISLQLRNSDDDKLPVVLWGKFACDVNEAMQVRDEHCTILVLRFGKIKEWKEERSVSNAYNVSELGLNLPMIEVGKFTDSLPKDVLPLAIVESKYAAIAKGVSDKDDFFTHTPRKTIAEMKETKQVEKCILMCTIAGIDSDMGWFYLSCKVCSKKVSTVYAVKDDDGNDDDDLKHTYYCVKCNAYNPVTIEETNVLPPVLNTIIGKTCLFKIQIERENFVYKHDTYKVLKVITNKDLIKDFEESNCRDGSEGVFHDMDTQSDAPEASLANQGSASEQFESDDLTPAKRVRAVDIELEEINDQNSVTRSTGSMMIKKEKFAKTMERKKRRGRTPEGLCNGRVSELISQTQISSAIDDEIQSSKLSSKRGVRIGREYVFYNPHIQKLARAQRRLRLSEKRGQLHKKTEPLPHRPETLDRAARAHRREIISTKRQNPVSANHPIVGTDENSLTIASDGIDTTNNVDNYSKRTTSAPNTDERCTENDSLYYGQKNTDATQRENLPLPVTKKRKTNPQNVFADITNVNLGCVRGETRRGETLEVMGQKRIHMEDSQTVFRWRRGWQSNVSSGSVVTSLRDLNGPVHSSQTCQNLPNVQAPIIPSRSQTKETMTENQCLLLGPEEEAKGVRLSSRKAKQKGIFLGVSSYASSKPLQFTPDPGSVITQVQPSQSTEQDLHEAEGRSYIISDESDSDDSLDELWDCSSNEEHDEETDSDTCEDATILQKIQRQANINKWELWESKNPSRFG